ncbi:hypothetical protein [Fulvitalea axinellae]
MLKARYKQNPMLSVLDECLERYEREVAVLKEKGELCLRLSEEAKPLREEWERIAALQNKLPTREHRLDFGPIRSRARRPFESKVREIRRAHPEYEEAVHACLATIYRMETEIYSWFKTVYIPMEGQHHPFVGVFIQLLNQIDEEHEKLIAITIRERFTLWRPGNDEHDEIAPEDYYEGRDEIQWQDMAPGDFKFVDENASDLWERISQNMTPLLAFSSGAETLAEKPEAPPYSTAASLLVTNAADVVKSVSDDLTLDFSTKFLSHVAKLLYTYHGRDLLRRLIIQSMHEERAVNSQAFRQSRYGHLFKALDPDEDRPIERITSEGEMIPIPKPPKKKKTASEPKYKRRASLDETSDPEVRNLAPDFLKQPGKLKDGKSRDVGHSSRIMIRHPRLGDSSPWVAHGSFDEGSFMFENPPPEVTHRAGHQSPPSEEIVEGWRTEARRKALDDFLERKERSHSLDFETKRPADGAGKTTGSLGDLSKAGDSHRAGAQGLDPTQGIPPSFKPLIGSSRSEEELFNMSDTSSVRSKPKEVALARTPSPVTLGSIYRKTHDRSVAGMSHGAEELSHSLALSTLRQTPRSTGSGEGDLFSGSGEWVAVEMSVVGDSLLGDEHRSPGVGVKFVKGKEIVDASRSQMRGVLKEGIDIRPQEEGPPQPFQLEVPAEAYGSISPNDKLPNPVTAWIPKGLDYSSYMVESHNYSKKRPNDRFLAIDPPFVHFARVLSGAIDAWEGHLTKEGRATTSGAAKDPKAFTGTPSEVENLIRGDWNIPRRKVGTEGKYYKARDEHTSY